MQSLDIRTYTAPHLLKHSIQGNLMSTTLMPKYSQDFSTPSDMGDFPQGKAIFDNET